MVTLAMIGKFGIAGSFAVIYVFSGELLPTVIRSQAMAVASFFAGLGLLFFPQILALVSMAEAPSEIARGTQSCSRIPDALTSSRFTFICTTAIKAVCSSYFNYPSISFNLVVVTSPHCLKTQLFFFT